MSRRLLLLHGAGGLSRVNPAELASTCSVGKLQHQEAIVKPILGLVVLARQSWCPVACETLCCTVSKKLTGFKSNLCAFVCPSHTC